MKAIIVNGCEHYQHNLHEGDKVTIVDGMETDAEGIWNIPAGKLVYCVTDDGRCGYFPINDLQIIVESEDEKRDEYLLRLRDEIAMRIYVKQDLYDLHHSNLRKTCAIRSIASANYFVKQLAEKGLDWNYMEHPLANIDTK